jgi:hypothetical protein
MEKIIEIILEDNVDISIKVNGNVEHTISTNKTISAKEIYDIIMVEKGDTITIKDMEENKKLGKENDILKYFYNMLKEIVDSISVSLVENDIEEISKEDKNEDSN